MLSEVEVRITDCGLAAINFRARLSGAEVFNVQKVRSPSVVEGRLTIADYKLKYEFESVILNNL